MKKVHIKIIHAFFNLTAFVCISGVIFLIGITLYLFILNMQFEERIYPHVYVNGVDFGGKNRTGLIRYFEEKNNELENTVITLRYGEDNIHTVSSEMLKTRYDTTTIVSHAFYLNWSGISLAKQLNSIKKPSLFSISVSIILNLIYHTIPSLLTNILTIWQKNMISLQKMPFSHLQMERLPFSSERKKGNRLKKTEPVKKLILQYALLKFMLNQIQ